MQLVVQKGLTKLLIEQERESQREFMSCFETTNTQAPRRYVAAHDVLDVDIDHDASI